MNLCLNMIVKNEGGRIERALLSAAPYITSWVIVDTGSTDDTKQKIKDFFHKRGIIGEIRDEPFIDWAQARNAALNWARKLSFAYQPDYILLMDADMELKVHDPIQFLGKRDGVSYEMYQQGGSVVYTNSRLVSVHTTGHYHGVTHEFLDVTTSGCIERSVAEFYDHADGANRPDKFKRDIRLLKAGLKKEPGNARYMFYLANSYRDAGKPEDAIKWYDRRIAAGGWDEEVWQARVYRAHCYSSCNRPDQFVAGLVEAYASRPQRAEALYDLAKHFREQPDKQAAALLFAEAGAAIPMTTDKLFVNEYVYKDGLKDEIAICGFYAPGKFMVGYKAAAEQALSPRCEYSRWMARNNLYHYVKPLAEFCPSFTWKNVNFQPPEHWAAMNPSVCLYKTALYCNVRCVNYRMDEEGRYLIRNTATGDINAEQPIVTRNFVCYLGNDPFHKPFPVYELLPPRDLPKEFPLVMGFEDVRLIAAGDDLWTSATVRQIHPDGNCEQVLSRVWPSKSADGPIAYHDLVHRMLRQPRATEKNWAPIQTRSTHHLFMHRPGEIVDADGKTFIKQETGLHTGHISGSSQVLPWGNDFLAITHEAHVLPNSHKRWYMHRFLVYDGSFRLVKLSLPFVFNDKVIEFCAGMAWHPNGKELVISYGYKDEEARIATVSTEEVENLLWKLS